MIAIESNPTDEIEAASTKALDPPENQVIARLLNEIAALLSDQGAGEFRVRAYRNASNTLSNLPMPVRDVLERDGLVGLIDLPTIGHSIANLIEQYLRLGRIPLLARLRGEETAERLFTTLPSIGPELSHRIHEHLQIESLPELYAAARNGRLEKVPGIGRKRVQAICECLAERLRHRTPQTQASGKTQTDQSVSVAELLEVDAEYRRLAAEGKLPKIAPRRFNPTSVAWLPILHTDRGDRHFTAMYSNTARAHELNTTKDWVIIYRDDPKAHGRWTVITSQFGKLRGCRVLPGREDECWQHYHPSIGNEKR